MKRREFITLLGGAGAAWPLVAGAQQPARPVIGFVSARGGGDSTYLVAGLHKGLKEAGFVEGQNVAIEYRWAEGRPERVPAMIAELVGRQVAVILAAGSAVALAAKAATATIPIVFMGGSDPVAIGLVTSLNRPGGNVTGSTIISHQIGAKRLEVLRQLVPNAGLIALLIESTNPSAETLGAATEAAARAIGLQTAAFAANSEASLEAAFAAMAQRQVNALFVGGGPLLGNLRQQTVALASRHGLPAMYSLREYVEVGGLMSYSSDFADSHRQAGAYAGRILKGEKPADLPILQPTKFELVLNLKTAKALGLAVPDKLLALADEVIE
jgi:putative tryptophan/tyrosine transport system substrate-binding protein